MSTVSIDPAWLEAPQFPVRRFTVDEYHQLGQVGLLSEDDRVELIEGLLVPKMNRTPLHDVALSMLDNALRRLLPESWKLRVQMAITTADSEPEPDIAIVRGPLNRYVEHHPGSPDIALVIEVAETSLVRDRRKARMYARAGIPQYWIVNLRERGVEIHTSPATNAAEPAYEQVRFASATESVALLLPNETPAELNVSEFLP